MLTSDNSKGNLRKNMGYVYIIGCVLFTVYGQLVLKWRMNLQPQIEGGVTDKVIALVKIIFMDPFVLSSFFAAFIASLFWMMAMSKFSLSFAYPFMSSAFVIVMIFSALFFGESLNWFKVAGTLLIVGGLIVLSQGYQS